MPNGKQLALGLTIAGAISLIAGLSWLLGPWPLIGFGVVLLGYGAFGVDV